MLDGVADLHDPTGGRTLYKLEDIDQILAVDYQLSTTICCYIDASIGPYEHPPS